MKKLLLPLIFTFACFASFGQSLVLEIPIVKTGEITDEETNTIISISTDDAEEENGEMDSLEDDDLDAGWQGEEGDANLQTVGLRFQNIMFQSSSTVEIDSAFIQVYCHESKGADDVSKLTIAGENDGNPETFTLDAPITSRSRTTAQVKWTVDVDWTIWEAYRTPDLKDIVSEIISIDGWANGNSMTFFLMGEDQGESTVENAREFESFENISDPEDTDPDGNPGDGQNHPERAPKLIIYYSVKSQSINQEQNASIVNIYPNPSTDGYFTVKLANSSESQIQLFDIAGKLVISQLQTSNQATINVSDFKAGIYFVRVTQDQIVSTQKVIVK